MVRINNKFKDIILNKTALGQKPREIRDELIKSFNLDDFETPSLNVNF